MGWLFCLQEMDPEKAAIIANSDDEHEEVEEEEVADTKDGDIADGMGAVLRNPQVMAALQARLDSIVGNQSGYIKVHGCFQLLNKIIDRN